MDSTGSKGCKTGVTLDCKLDELYKQRNNEDNDHQTESEIAASRQVISLLQRQIKKLREDKEEIEKLYKHQSKMLSQNSKPDLAIYDETVNKNYNCSLVPANTSLNFDDSLHNNIFQNESISVIESYRKDELIAKLQSLLKDARNENEQQSLQILSYEEENNRLHSKLATMQEIVTTQEEKITSLANYKYNNEHLMNANKTQFKGRRMSAFANDMLRSRSNSSAKVNEALEVSNERNELMKIHIEKLTKKLVSTEKRESDLKSDCLELEAKCCQIQSKLLTLLKEIEQVCSSTSNGKEQQNSKLIVDIDDTSATNEDNVISNNEAIKILIKRLLEDKSLDIPLSWKEGNKLNKSRKSSLKCKSVCDELGFYQSTDSNAEAFEALIESSSDSIERLQINSFSSNLNSDARKKSKQISDNLLTVYTLDSAKSNETQWRQRWDVFIKEFDNKDLDKSKEVKNLLRSGIPQEYRCKVWKALIEYRIGDERRSKNPNYYQELLDSSSSFIDQNSVKTTINPAAKQIELDLLRTLPNNKHFETLESSGTVRLKRVLEAYSKRNPKVGYCQGMNRLAAVALLILPEIEAFWCLVAIVEKIMPKNYYTDLWMAQIDSSVTLDYVATKIPNLRQHFDRNQIELSLFAWFLTIFVDGTSPGFYLRLWDCFMFEGDKVLFRVALALLKTNENQLGTLKNSVAVNNYLRASIMKIDNLDSFYEIVFQWTNPLSSKSLQAKRINQRRLLKLGDTNDRFSNNDCSDNEESTPNLSSIRNVAASKIIDI